MRRSSRILEIAVLASVSFGGTVAVRAQNASNAAPAFDWTGFYIGGHIAEDFTSTLYKRPLDPSLADTTIGSIGDKAGVGASVGFNYQFSRWGVVGLEATETWMDAPVRELGSSNDFLEHIDSVAAVSARAGLLVRPDTMVFGSVGPAWMRVNGFKGFGQSMNAIVPGVQLGAGFETFITRNVSLRVEGSYTGATQALVLNNSFDHYLPSILQVQFGAEYKFDAPGGWGFKDVAVSDAVGAPPKWTGFEVGGFASVNGNQMGYSDLNQGDSGPYTRFGIGGGAFVGANYQLNDRFVVGAELSGNYNHARLVNAAGTNGYLGPLFDFATIENFMALTGRVGALLSPGTLIYVKAGGAWVQTTTDFGYWNNVAPNSTGSRTMGGYQVGLGDETFITSNVSLRFETIYTHPSGTISLNGSVFPNQFALRPAVLSATSGVAYHF